MKNISTCFERNPQKQRGFILKFLAFILLIIATILAAIYIIYLNNTIVSKFESRRWDIPATLYSRPLTLYSGASLSADDFENWLKLLNYSQGSIKTTGHYTKNGKTYTVHTRGFDYGDGDYEKKQLIEIQFQNNTIVSLRSNQPSQTGQLRLEPVNFGGIYPTNNEDRILLTKDKVPSELIDALIATEDRGFYQHHGISLRGITRALMVNISGKATQGGSTITQQLIKNFYLNSDRTLKRKITEALMAVLLELHYSKEDILLAYLNEINLGQNGNRSVNGFAIASQFYFNKPLNELTLEQHALLVGIAKGPSYYNPRKHPKRALQRRNTVLKNLQLTGKINEADYQKFSNQALNVAKTPSIAKSRFPDFLDALQRELKTYYREEDLQNKGLKIISTLDPIAQTAANAAMSKKLGELRKQGGKLSSLQGALVSAHPATGELLALVGSGSDFTGFNRAIDAKRQVGSLLKPVIYLTAFQSGRYHLGTPVSDEQISYQVGGKTWTPKNYDGKSHGSPAAIYALSNSYNQAAVHLGVELGMPAFQAQLHNLSITQNIPAYPSAMLGAIDLSPMDILGVYQIFANGGAYTPIHSVRTVIDESGRVLQRSQTKHQFRAPPQAVYLLNRALQETITTGTAKAANSINGELNLAGKTGTTNDYRDAWFAGYSGNYVSIVWVGRDDNKPIGLSGGKGALPIWTDYMRRLNLTPVNLPKPTGVNWAWVDTNTGLLTFDYCPNAKWLPVIDAYRPSQSGCVHPDQLDMYDDFTDNLYTDDIFDENTTHLSQPSLSNKSESELFY